MLLHAASWLHKRFSSSKVYFLSTPSTSTGSSIKSLPVPYVTGFAFARPHSDAYESISLDAVSRKDVNDASGLGDFLYAHPSLVGPRAPDYSRAFDIFSLGLVLLEIGLWTRLEALLPSGSRLRDIMTKAAKVGMDKELEALQGEIFARVSQLTIFVGDVFEEAVTWCLRGLFRQREGVESMDIGVEFYWRVVKKLEQCKV